MRYEIDAAMLQTLLPAIAGAEDALARLDERVARSPVGQGFAERSHSSMRPVPCGWRASLCMSKISSCTTPVWIAAHRAMS